MPADTKCRGFVKENRFHSLLVGLSAENREHNSGAIFLHLGGHCENIQRTGFQQPCPDITNGLARDIIEVGFQEPDTVSVR